MGERREASQAAAEAARRGTIGRRGGSRYRAAPHPAASPGTSRRAQIAPAAKPQAPPLAPIGRRERAHLSRGRKEIDARIDLHGMTQTRAHRALFGFLQRAHHDGLTFVLVITGKGKIGAESERGVLRRQVPQWLACRNSAAGGRLRGSPYRPWRRGRALCPGAAGEDLI